MHAINGKNVALLAADGVELVELTEPWHTLQRAGANVQLVSLFTGGIQGMHHDRKADIVRGRKVTSWPSLKTDLKNAGAEWVDAECMIDNGLDHQP